MIVGAVQARGGSAIIGRGKTRTTKHSDKKSGERLHSWAQTGGPPEPNSRKPRVHQRRSGPALTTGRGDRVATGRACRQDTPRVCVSRAARAGARHGAQGGPPAVPAFGPRRQRY